LRLLLDTHTLIWWLAGDPSLSATARKAVAGLLADLVLVSNELVFDRYGVRRLW